MTAGILALGACSMLAPPSAPVEPDTAQWSGRLHAGTGVGEYGWTVTTGGERRCTITYAVDLADPIADCPGCTVAFEIHLGAVTTHADAGGCNDEHTLEDAAIRLGHRPPNTLLGDDGSGWTPIGTSALRADKWTFTLPDRG